MAKRPCGTLFDFAFKRNKTSNKENTELLEDENTRTDESEPESLESFEEDSQNEELQEVTSKSDSEIPR